jgi:hypothetical protein
MYSAPSAVVAVCVCAKLRPSELQTSLFSYVHKHHPPSACPRTWSVAAECTQALAAVHQVTLHLSINPHTVRLVNGSVRLSGFGICQPLTTVGR